MNNFKLPQPTRKYSTDDMVIEALADERAELHQRVCSLEADCDSYRTLAQQAIHALSDLTQRNGRIAEERDRLRAENRDLRAMLIDADIRMDHAA